MKKSLILSVVSLVLSICMLLSTTYAWFTDTAVSRENKIVSGTLDVSLHRGTDTSAALVTNDTLLFDGVSYWEPGALVYEDLTIANSGSLALSYKFKLLCQNVVEYGGKSLLDVLRVGILQGGVPEGASREETVAAVTTWYALRDLVLGGELLAGESKTFAVVIHWPYGENDNEYSPRKTGGTVLSVDLGVVLLASQYTLEEDSFGKDYDADASTKVIKRQLHVLPNACAELPSSALAAARGVVFSGSPYAYLNTALFAGGHVVRLGIPVKSVQALDNEQTFTLSVVKTTNGTANGGDNYEYVSKVTLTLPREQLGNHTTVNDWVYVDVDVTLQEGETLAFGMPTDTVEWAYLPSKMDGYTFRSNKTNWSTAEGASIFFDVVMEEELVFEQSEYGLAAITTSSVLPNATADLPEGEIASGRDVEFPTAPYAYVNTSLFAGKHITRLGIPVKRVAALNDQQIFTLTVVKQNTNPYTVVKTYELKLPLEQLGSSTTVNKWVYVDLDLTLAADETLAFGGQDDTVVWAWKSGGSAEYRFRNKNGGTSQGIYFDVQSVSVYTYEQYLRDVAEEEARLEAEQAQKKRDEALAKLLSGKKISILGDSISTFKGYSNNTSYNSTIGGNAVYYSGSNYITTVKETWWMQAIDRLDLSLLVNNSWSGDTVTGRGISRSLQLHDNTGATPDIIAVYLGVNDFRTKVSAATFATAYDEMIAGMKARYPDAEVYLFTLVYTTNVNSGVNPDDIVYFNEAIAATAQKYGCTLVDLYNDSGINKTTMESYMGDKNLHPNYAGMDLITDTFIDVLAEKYLENTAQ